MTGIKIPWHGWVTVCDGSKALLLRNDGDEVLINLQVFDTLKEHHLATHEIGSDRPGRVFESATTARSANQETDLHDQAESEFLAKLAERLDRLVQEQSVKHLVLVAPPRALGQLRTMLSPIVQAVIQAEIDKDLVNQPVYRIEKHLAG